MTDIYFPIKYLSTIAKDQNCKIEITDKVQRFRLPLFPTRFWSNLVDFLFSREKFHDIFTAAVAEDSQQDIKKLIHTALDFSAKTNYPPCVIVWNHQGSKYNQYDHIVDLFAYVPPEYIYLLDREEIQFIDEKFYNYIASGLKLPQTTTIQ